MSSYYIFVQKVPREPRVSFHSISKTSFFLTIVQNCTNIKISEFLFHVFLRRHEMVKEMKSIEWHFLVHQFCTSKTLFKRFVRYFPVSIFALSPTTAFQLSVIVIPKVCVYGIFKEQSRKFQFVIHVVCCILLLLSFHLFEKL